MIEIPGVEEDWLRQRVAFLVSRAQNHLEQPSEDFRYKACAATLIRDAGCLSLFLGEVVPARRYLVQAGELLLDMGLAAGLPFIAIGDGHQAQEAMLAYEAKVEAVTRRTDDATGPADSSRAIAALARGSLRSMLSVVQTEMLMSRHRLALDGEHGFSDSDERRARREGAQRGLVERYAGREVGETGLSVGRYMRVAETFEARRSETAKDMPENVIETIELLGRRRAERVEVARRDEFHWRLVPRPAELLDLDSVALMLVVGGRDQDNVRGWLGRRGGGIVEAPFEIAELLSPLI